MKLKNILITVVLCKIKLLPAGFILSPIESEQHIDTGLVIIDKNGNEFVWVPVDDFSEFKREHFGTAEQKTWSGTFVEDAPSENDLYEPTPNNTEHASATTAKEVKEMYKSVEENHGFYIGRYEAGTTNVRGNDSTITDEALVRKDVYVYNWVNWKDADIEEETGGAVQLAREFSKKNGYTSVTSTLCYGVQWDAILRWMNKNDKLKEIMKDSTGKGWHSDIASENHKTGVAMDSNRSNCINNIYDMAGNVWEWTMETCFTDNNIVRGGSFVFKGDECPISIRSYYGNNYDLHGSVGFRIALYLN